jgi:hypothetical protein
MRQFLTRLALTGVVGLALSGCGTSNGTPLSGSAGGGGSVPSTNGIGAPPAGTAPKIVLDNGTVPPKYSGGFNAYTVSDAHSPLKSRSDAPATVVGSHLITYSTSGGNTYGFKYGGELPNLTYEFGFGGSAAYFNYTHISLDAYTAFGTPPAGTFSSIDIELVGGSGAAAYDAKIVCATYPSADTPADLINGFNQYVCIVPAYGSASGTYTTTYNATEGKFVETGPTGTGSENTFATGLVTLQSPTLYVDVVVTAPSASSTGNTLGIANVVATQ